MNLMVNKLPSRTWNHLKMNESVVNVEEALNNHTPQADHLSEQVLWNPDSGVYSADLPGDLEPIVSSAKSSLAETQAGTHMEVPLVLSYRYEKGEQAASCLTLHAEAGSHLKVIQILSGDAAASAVQTKIYADQDSVVDLYVVELLGAESLCHYHVAGVAADRAKINLIKLELGAGRIYAGANMDLKGSESSFCSETGYHVKPAQVLDMNYVAVHHGKRTESNMEINGTLEEGARKIFRGTIDFRQGCAGAKAAENENVMLMGDEMVNQTIPVILCKEEDVEGNHGASIGQLDDKILFYLASRGISKEAAQAMIAQARIDAICEKIPVEEVRAQIREFEEIRGISHGEEF